MSLQQAQAPLTRRGIPLERDLRVLALGSFANRFGAGAVMTTSALYFTRQVGFSAAEVALALAVAAVVSAHNLDVETVLSRKRNTWR